MHLTRRSDKNTFSDFGIVFLNAQHKDTNTRVIKFPQHAHIFKVNSCLKVHNAHFQVNIAKLWIDLSPEIYGVHRVEAEFSITYVPSDCS